MVREAGASNPPPSHLIFTYHPAVKNLKQILMEHWSLIRNQLLLKTIFQNIQSSLTKREHRLKTRPVSLFLIRFQESKQDLIDSALLSKRETGSS